ncbi:MAG: hypothetical protein BMS9Abin34_435 [Patescibacteria group bacterium]|nr:MAG: hypothetical protein BMS9Abin34_435 [Patescibacteria group bacterium]
MKRLKQLLKAFTPRFILGLYQAQKRGSWFDPFWRWKYKAASDEQWKNIYNARWEHDPEESVSIEDLKLAGKYLDKAKAKSVLDVGSGSGKTAIFLAGLGFKVSGLDVSTKAIDLARERAQEAKVGVNFYEGRVGKLPFGDKSFDAVLAFHVLEHVASVEDAVSELERVAKRLVLIIVPSQKHDSWAANYHTQFFEKKEDLIRVMSFENFECGEFDRSRSDGYPGKILFYAGFAM